MRFVKITTCQVVAEEDAESVMNLMTVGKDLVAGSAYYLRFIGLGGADARAAECCRDGWVLTRQEKRLRLPMVGKAEPT
jgi:hypothetical protein